MADKFTLKNGRIVTVKEAKSTKTKPAGTRVKKVNGPTKAEVAKAAKAAEAAAAKAAKAAADAK